MKLNQLKKLNLIYLFVAISLSSTACSKVPFTLQGPSNYTPAEYVPGHYPVIERGALAGAAAVGDLEMVQSLVIRGVDVNENFGTENEPVTALIAAAIHGKKEVMEYLIENGADQSLTFNGYTASDYFYFWEALQ